jgi:asparaginyl-tRNA synthetase
MQFMLEYGCRLSPEGAWYLMPSFRGEDADATHLNQFFHSEAEIIGGLDDVMRVSEEYTLTMIRAIARELGDDIEEIAGTRDHLDELLAAGPFPRITLDEAEKHLGGDTSAIYRDPAGYRVLTRHGEHRLMREISPAVWVTHYDHLSVPFYQAYSPDNPALALNADLIFGPGEVIGCGERHVDGQQVRHALEHHQVPEDDYRWYVDMKDARPMHTSGFGLGVERFMMWALAHPDIRDLQLLPRYNGVPTIP